MINELCNLFPLPRHAFEMARSFYAYFVIEISYRKTIVGESYQRKYGITKNKLILVFFLTRSRIIIFRFVFNACVEPNRRLVYVKVWFFFIFDTTWLKKKVRWRFIFFNCVIWLSKWYCGAIMSPGSLNLFTPLLRVFVYSGFYHRLF